MATKSDISCKSVLNDTLNRDDIDLDARWTVTSSHDTETENSGAGEKHACEVCQGSLEMGLTDEGLPQAPPPANLGRGSQEPGKIDDDVEDLTCSNECDTTKLRTGKSKATHWEVEGHCRYRKTRPQ